MLGLLGTGFRDSTIALQQLQTSLGAVVRWLAATGTVQQLNFLGYQPENMRQPLAAAAKALQTLSAAPTSVLRS